MHFNSYSTTGFLKKMFFYNNFVESIVLSCRFSKVVVFEEYELDWGAAGVLRSGIP